jgi:hypothetical protein
MDSQDRTYFMMRAKTEWDAAGRSHGPARARHEELASAYQMRVMCIDKGYSDLATEVAREPAAEPSAGNTPSISHLAVTIKA